jgi:hypothetical protein
LNHEGQKEHEGSTKVVGAMLAASISRKTLQFLCATFVSFVSLVVQNEKGSDDGRRFHADPFDGEWGNAPAVR